MEHLLIALKEYGTKEIIGVQHNPDVLKYFKDIGHSWVKDDETAWCAAFANWCLKKAGYQHTGKLNARSFLDYGQATENPILGDVVVLWRISRYSVFGHVGFFIKEAGNRIYILGGNQADQVNISAFSKDQLLGYRKIPAVKHDRIL